MADPFSMEYQSYSQVGPIYKELSGAQTLVDDLLNKGLVKRFHALIYFLAVCIVDPMDTIALDNLALIYENAGEIARIAGTGADGDRGSAADSSLDFGLPGQLFELLEMRMRVQVADLHAVIRESGRPATDGSRTIPPKAADGPRANIFGLLFHFRRELVKILELSHHFEDEAGRALAALYDLAPGQIAPNALDLMRSACSSTPETASPGRDEKSRLRTRIAAGTR